MKAIAQVEEEISVGEYRLKVVLPKEWLGFHPYPESQDKYRFAFDIESREVTFSCKPIPKEAESSEPLHSDPRVLLQSPGSP